MCVSKSKTTGAAGCWKDQGSPVRLSETVVSGGL